MLPRTYIIFASDNGGCYLGGGKNAPLRGTKATILEGGTRVDAFLYSPLLSSSIWQGKDFPHLMHVTGMLPTDTHTTSSFSFDTHNHHTQILLIYLSHILLISLLFVCPVSCVMCHVQTGSPPCSTWQASVLIEVLLVLVPQLLVGLVLRPPVPVPPSVRYPPSSTHPLAPQVIPPDIGKYTPSQEIPSQQPLSIPPLNPPTHPSIYSAPQPMAANPSLMTEYPTGPHFVDCSQPLPRHAPKCCTIHSWVSRERIEVTTHHINAPC